MAGAITTKTFHNFM